MHSHMLLLNVIQDIIRLLKTVEILTIHTVALPKFTIDYTSKKLIKNYVLCKSVTRSVMLFMLRVLYTEYICIRFLIYTRLF